MTVEITAKIVQLKASAYSHTVSDQSWHSTHTPSIAFRQLLRNSDRTGYATEGALFISGQLSTDAVNALRKVWVLIRLWKRYIICADVSNVGGY